MKQLRNAKLLYQLIILTVSTGSLFGMESDATKKLWILLWHGNRTQDRADRFKELIDKEGADIKIKKDGYTPLEWAIEISDTYAIKTLQAYQTLGAPELELTIKKHIKQDIIALFLKHGADPITPISPHANPFFLETVLRCTMNSGYFHTIAMSRPVTPLSVATIILTHMVNTRRKALCFMLCLNRNRTNHPGIELLVKQSKILLKKHVLAIIKDENKPKIRTALTQKQFNYWQKSEMELRKRFPDTNLPEQEPKGIFDCLPYDIFNPENIDQTTEALFQE